MIMEEFYGFLVCSACSTPLRSSEIELTKDDGYTFFTCPECGFSTLVNLGTGDDDDVREE